MVSPTHVLVQRTRLTDRHSPIERLESRTLLTGDLDLSMIIGSELADEIRSAAADADGNLYVVGCIRGKVDLAPGKQKRVTRSRGASDAFVAKYSPAGSLIWSRQLGSSGCDEGSALALTPAGDVVVAGAFKRTLELQVTTKSTTKVSARGGTDVFVLSLTDGGDVNWLRHLGGNGADTVKAVATSPSGQIAVAGSFITPMSLRGQKDQPVLRSAGRQDGFVWRLTVAGRTTGAFAIGGPADDMLHDVALGADGTVYATGHFAGTADFQPGDGTSNLTSAGAGDVFVAAWNVTDTLVRAVSAGGTGDDAGNAIAVDAAGNVYVTGNYAGTGDFDPGTGTSPLTSVTGTSDAFLLKLDRNLAFGMAKTIGGAGSDVGLDVAVDAGGSIYIAGSFEQTPDFDTGFGTFNMTSAGKTDGFLAKLAPSGSFSYARQIGGRSDDAVRSISITRKNGVVTAGSFKGDADFDPGADERRRSSEGQTDGFVWRLSQQLPSFNLARNFAGTGDKSLPGFAISRADYIYSAGSFTGTLTLGSGDTAIRYNSRGQDDVWIGKACNKCLLRWAWSIGGSGSDAATGTAVLPDGSMLVAGWFSGTVDFDPSAADLKLTSAGGRDVFVMRLDADGNVKWAQRYGGTGDDAATAIAAEGDDVYITGTFRSAATFGSTTLASAGGDDVFLARLGTTAGAVAWAARAGGASADHATAMALDAKRNVVVAGRFNGDLGFDPGGTANVPTGGTDDIFVWKTTRSGAFAWAKPIPLSASGAVASVATDADDNVYLAGAFAGTIDYDGSGGAAPVGSTGGTDAFLATLDHAGTLSRARTFGGAADDSAATVSVDTQRNVVYVAGRFADRFVYDELEMTSAGQSDAFLLRLDDSGDLSWGGRAGGAGDDRATHVLLGGGGSFVYVAGTFTGAGDFDMTDGVLTLQPNGTRDVFVTRLIL